ncbi:MAG: ankyrin repeat domain-containing protein, partial [bacterium]
MTATRGQGRRDLDAALVKAAGDGEPHTVAVLIGLGADVEAVDEDGKKALMLAAQNGHTAT